MVGYFMAYDLVLKFNIHVAKALVYANRQHVCIRINSPI